MKLCPRCSCREKSANEAYCKPCRADYNRDYARGRGASHAVFTCGSCVVCGTGFVSANKNRIIGKYCSLACEKKAVRRRYNARTRGARKLRGEALTWGRVVLRDPCAYCGTPSAEIEHIVPRAAGGADSWDNLTGACVACNASKSIKSLLTFLLGKISTS